MTLGVVFWYYFGILIDLIFSYILHVKAEALKRIEDEDGVLL
jgi:hypothetical protein